MARQRLVLRGHPPVRPTRASARPAPGTGQRTAALFGPDSLQLGVSNHADKNTFLDCSSDESNAYGLSIIMSSRSQSVYCGLMVDCQSGIPGSDGIGVIGGGRRYGVWGDAGVAGVYGTGRGDGEGVIGQGTIGVHGFAIRNHIGVRGENYGPDANGVGVEGTSGLGDGVRGQGAQAGVRGSATSDAGVGVFGTGKTTGVRGRSAGGDSASAGVVGECIVDPDGRGGQGNGVHGTSLRGDGVFGQGVTSGVHGESQKGVGVLAEAGPSGTALAVQGRLAFSSAGALRVPKGALSASESGLVLGKRTMVIATAQSESAGGAHVIAAAADPSAGTITVFLDQAPTAPLLVAWLAFEPAEAVRGPARPTSSVRPRKPASR